MAETTDPFFNLATEDWIFNDMDPGTKVLFLWRNDKSIIVGRGQNVWSECLLDQAEKDGVQVVRRHSGGGAVYQDLGNTCFTFMRAKEKNRSTKELYADNNRVLIGALRRLGVEAVASGRNDLVVNIDESPFKISGSAFKESRDRCFHHGTMLMTVDLNKLSSYLTPDSKKLKAKGIKSVKSRVMNLTDLVTDIHHQSFCQALTEEFFRFHGSRCDVEQLDSRALEQIETLADYYRKLKSWDWVYGKTPHFQHSMQERFPWGGCQLHLDTEKGVVREAKVYTDSLVPELFEEVPSFLRGRTYSKDGVREAKRTHLEAATDNHDLLKDFYDWVVDQL
jgi:lipoate-protein ligase A